MTKSILRDFIINVKSHGREIGIQYSLYQLRDIFGLAESIITVKSVDGVSSMMSESNFIQISGDCYSRCLDDTVIIATVINVSENIFKISFIYEGVENFTPENWLTYEDASKEVTEYMEMINTVFNKPSENWELLDIDIRIMRIDFHSLRSNQYVKFILKDLSFFQSLGIHNETIVTYVIDIPGIENSKIILTSMDVCDRESSVYREISSVYEWSIRVVRRKDKPIEEVDPSTNLSFLYDFIKDSENRIITVLKDGEIIRLRKSPSEKSTPVKEVEKDSIPSCELPLSPADLVEPLPTKKRNFTQAVKSFFLGK